MVPRMTTFWGLDATAWAALAALGTFGLVLVASITAVAAFHQVRESRRIREEQTRPYVVVSVEPSPASRQLLDVVIRNVGSTPAIGTRIEIEPPLKRADEDDQFPLAKARVFTEPIALIAPGYTMTVFLDNGIERKDRDDLPEVHTATVTYADSTGRPLRDTYTLDLAAQRGSTWIGVKGEHDAAKALEVIAESFSKAPLLTGQVEAVIETRRGAGRRLAHERQAARARHNKLMEMMGRTSGPEQATSRAADQALVRKLKMMVKKARTRHRVE